MQRHLETMRQLVSMMDPVLYDHLQKMQATHFLYCYRWFLVLFKREYPDLNQVGHLQEYALVSVRHVDENT